MLVLAVGAFLVLAGAIRSQVKNAFRQAQRMTSTATVLEKVSEKANNNRPNLLEDLTSGEGDFSEASRWLRAHSPIAEGTELEQYFEEKGFHVSDFEFRARPLSGPLVINDKQILNSQGVRIKVDCRTDLAVFAQVCGIEGDVHGDLYFGGQSLEICKDATIHGSLHILGAQVARIHGVVKGDITGVRPDHVSLRGEENVKGETRAESPIQEWLENRLSEN